MAEAVFQPARNEYGLPLKDPREVGAEFLG